MAYSKSTSDARCSQVLPEFWGRFVGASSSASVATSVGRVARFSVVNGKSVYAVFKHNTLYHRRTLSMVPLCVPVSFSRGSVLVAKIHIDYAILQVDVGGRHLCWVKESHDRYCSLRGQTFKFAQSRHSCAAEHPSLRKSP